MIILRCNMPTFWSKLKKLWVIQYFWSFTTCSHSNFLRLLFRYIHLTLHLTLPSIYLSISPFIYSSYPSSHPSSIHLTVHLFKLPLHLTLQLFITTFISPFNSSSHFLSVQFTSSSHLPLPNFFPALHLTHHLSLHLTLHLSLYISKLPLHLTHLSSHLSSHLIKKTKSQMKGEMKRYERDEVMKKIGPDICQAKYGVILNSLYWGVGVSLWKFTDLHTYIHTL